MEDTEDLNSDHSMALLNFVYTMFGCARIIGSSSHESETVARFAAT